MTEHERAEQFQRDIDALLRGETPVAADADDRALLDLARRLLAADFSAETRRDLLRPKLAKPTWKGLIMSPAYRPVRWFVTAAVLFTIAIAAILTVPPLRAIAQDILRQIGFIAVLDTPTVYDISQTVIPSPTLDRQPNTAVDPVPPATAPKTFTDESPEAIAAEVGYAVAVIVDIPQGLKLSGRTAWSNPLMRQLHSSYYSASGEIMIIDQVVPNDPTYDNGPLMAYPIGDAPTEAVNVGEYPAIWVEEWRISAELAQHLLIWEQDGFSFSIASTLPRDRIFAVAESLEFFGEPEE